MEKNTELIDIIKELRNKYSDKKYSKYRNSQNMIDVTDDDLKYDLNKQAEIAAQKITNIFWTNQNIPLKIGNLVNTLGFKAIVNTNFKDKNLSGILGLNANRKLGEDYPDKIIMVNGNDNVGHQRFTIAHELAHYIFDAIHGEEYYEAYYITDRNNANMIREYRANKFAANLLMPTILFIKRYQELSNKTPDKDAIIINLARIFEVSLTAVQKRIKELDL